MNRITSLLAKMDATASLINILIDKAKGKVPPIKKEPIVPENGIRTYIVSDIMPSCVKCGKSNCGEQPRDCGQASWFPIFHRVVMTITNGIVVSVKCNDGRKSGGEPCDKAPCKHIERAKNAWLGLPSKGVDLSMISGVPVTMPKCPNCREQWSVNLVGEDKYECHSPACMRDEKPWQFEAGSKDRPPPMRNTLSMRDRDPGRVIVKRGISKRWGML
jgi:hypothetical protein